ncbi:lysoplasmalogenase family protein [Ammonicoccus fulvus]|uniref:Lysoplasmalogenase family protein n=1 Tax=Ammonicoccus fulvus TaxID=3138240 RepID=A0ABZ3FM08_9ACTN
MSGSKPRLAWLAYLLVGLIQVTALALNIREVSVPAQIVLMPTLALAALTAPRGRLRTWTLVALFFSFLGDMLPQVVAESWKLPLMLGSFFLAHVAWVTGFWGVRKESALWRRPWTVLPYLAIGVAMVVWCWPGAGVLAPAVALYALALLSTATLATALGRAGWFGGALFILSDGLIAARSFAGFGLPQQDVVVMATYILAHGLLVLGMIRFLQARRSRI